MVNSSGGPGERCDEHSHDPRPRRRGAVENHRAHLFPFTLQITLRIASTKRMDPPRHLQAQDGIHNMADDAERTRSILFLDLTSDVRRSADHRLESHLQPMERVLRLCRAAEEQRTRRTASGLGVNKSPHPRPPPAVNNGKLAIIHPKLRHGRPDEMVMQRGSIRCGMFNISELISFTGENTSQR